VGELLEQLNATQADNRQGRLQIERILQEASANNRESNQLLERMGGLSATSETRQQENNQLNAELQQVLQQHSSSRDELVELVYDCRVVRDKTSSVLETSEQLNSDSQAGIIQLNDTMSASKQDLQQLIVSTRKINADANQSLDSMRTSISDSTLIKEQCIRVNKESIAATLEAKSSAQKLAEELESSMKVNQHYQERLKLAEKKYLDASKTQKEYRQLHDTSLAALRENEAMLGQARATIKDYSDNSVEYTNSIKQFQQTSIQSQQIILDTQATIKSLLTSNEQMTEENRFRKIEGPKREPPAGTTGWPSMDTELRADGRISPELGLAQENAEQHKNEWQLD
jgi:hypothetical protein